MPDLVVPDLGELVLIARMLAPDANPTDPFLLHLYTNDYTPNKVSVLADFDECTIGSYAPISLTNADWNAPTTVGGVAQSTWGTGLTTFEVSSGTEPIFGYFITDDAGTVVVWAQRFDDMQTLSVSTPVSLIPVMRLHSESEPDP